MHYSPGSRVAVIGAGIGGVCAAAHLLKYGISVTVIERCDVAGGVWHLDKRIAHESRFPNNQPSRGDYTRYDGGNHSYMTPPATPEHESKRSRDLAFQSVSRHEDYDRISHAPPGPCYSSLRNNVPLTLMRTSLHPWPPGLEEFVSQKYLEEYIQQISKTTGVDEVTEYNTRVEQVMKKGVIWEVTTAVLRIEPSGVPQVSLQTRKYDAVVVASGHYHMPRIPDIPGLQEWKARFPSRIRHSKRYRSAEGLDGQKVLLIGSGVSSCDIAKDLASKNTETYQSSRGGVLDLPSTLLPENALRIGPVKSFSLDEGLVTGKSLAENDTLPGFITLQNNSKICGLHQIILATGYITSYPFLPQYHSDTEPRTSAGDRLLVTSEGDMIHNLHKDIFYIEDPTLAFVGVPYHTATFSLFDFQSQVVARVLAGLLRLPTKEAMRDEYKARVKAKGLGRDFHSLRGMNEEVDYVRELVEWANHNSLSSSSEPMSGHSDEYLAAYSIQRERLNAVLAGQSFDPDSGRYDDVPIPETITCL